MDMMYYILSNRGKVNETAKKRLGSLDYYFCERSSLPGPKCSQG